MTETQFTQLQQKKLQPLVLYIQRTIFCCETWSGGELSHRRGFRRQFDRRRIWFGQCKVLDMSSSSSEKSKVHFNFAASKTQKQVWLGPWHSRHLNKWQLLHSNCCCDNGFLTSVTCKVHHNPRQNLICNPSVAIALSINIGFH